MDSSGLIDYSEAIDSDLILETIPTGLFIVDHKGVIRVWNSRMAEISGYTAKQAIGKPCSFLACAADGDKSQWTDRCPLLNGLEESIEGYECRIETKLGERVPVMKNARAIRKDGRTVGVLQTITDLRPIRGLEAEVAALRRVSISTINGRMIGKSHAIQQVYEQIGLAANSETTILILGETGTGKELAVDEIHNRSSRKGGPLIKVNCSALSEGLLESELFGHVKGAFTGAVMDKVGRFELADGGTIFLDEIGDISPLIQVKLLRVLQEREIERVGEGRTRKVDVRVIAATNRDMTELVQSGEFRQDLYYRLRVFPIHMPPLRDRSGDIPLLIDHFVKHFSEETGKSIKGVSAEARSALMDACYPGNIRELANAIEHGFVACQTDEISLFDLPLEIRRSDLRQADCGMRQRPMLPQPHQQPSTRQRLESKDFLLRVLRECNWNKSEAARRLGVTRVTVWRKMKEWGISLDKD